MSIWLLKTEPTVYSMDNLTRDGTTTWDGVGNNLALKYLRQMRPGDTALIYHTGAEKAWVGMATITSAAYPDPVANDPRLVVADIKCGRTLRVPVTLAQMKSQPGLTGWDLLRIPRLSVVPVTPDQWKILQGAAGL